MRPKDYPNIIFDLGGVILNINYQLTIDAFVKLGVPDFENSYSQLVQTEVFDRYEKGEITSSEFRDGLRSVFRTEVTDAAIDAAWNAMLLDLPKERLALLEKLGSEKRIVLLSNTNEIHIDEFNRILAPSMGKDGFADLFGKLYYSFELGMRKPEKGIFEHVVNEQGFDPTKTLFIDDSPQHVEGARSAGLNAYHLRVDRGETILDLF